MRLVKVCRNSKRVHWRWPGIKADGDNKKEKLGDVRMITGCVFVAPTRLAGDNFLEVALKKLGRQSLLLTD